jgi:hypothetical protein
MLGANCELSDSEIEILRDQLTQFANVAIDLTQGGAFDAIHSTLSGDRRAQEARYEIEERASILEFEAGMSRPLAECVTTAAALKITIEKGGGDGRPN